MTSHDLKVKRQGHDSNMLRAQYLENSWRCCEAVRSTILATAWLFVKDRYRSQCNLYGEVRHVRVIYLSYFIADETRVASACRITRHGTISHRCDKRLQRLQKILCKRVYYFVTVYLNKNHMSETKQNYDGKPSYSALRSNRSLIEFIGSRC